MLYLSLIVSQSVLQQYFIHVLLATSFIINTLNIYTNINFWNKPTFHNVKYSVVNLHKMLQDTENKR